MRFSNGRSKIPFLSYTAMLSAMLAIAVILGITGNGSAAAPSNIGPGFDLVFYDAVTDNILEDPSGLYDSIGSSGAVYFTIPENLGDILDPALCVKTHHAIFSAYLDDMGSEGNIIFSSRDPGSYPLSDLYTDSPGTEYARIGLRESYAGHRIYLEYKLAYDKDGYGFLDVSIARPDDFALGILRDKFPTIILCVAYVMLGVILVIVGWLTSKFSVSGMSLFWLGAFALSVAFYCLLETQALQLFFNNPMLLHLLVMFAMLVIPLPAVAYVDSLLNIKSARLVPGFSILVSGSFFVLMALNLAGVCDYHDALLLMQGYIIIAVLIMAAGMIRHIIKRIKADRRVGMYTWSMIIGVSGIMIASLIDILRYYLKSSHGDPTAALRFGFLVFLGGFAVASSERVVGAFKDSARAKIISKLAYEDGLTGLLNRTSYQEAVQEIELNHIRTGVVMMDLNNLKYVNDNMGHDDGDAMLVAAANLIRDAYGGIEGAKCYRIGGDEFVVLVSNDSIEYSCEDGMRRMREAYNKFNAETDKRFKLVIAAGYSICEFSDSGSDPGNDSGTFKAAADRADGLMYEDKRELKQLKLANIMA